MRCDLRTQEEFIFLFLIHNLSGIKIGDRKIAPERFPPNKFFPGLGSQFGLVLGWGAIFHGTVFQGAIFLLPLKLFIGFQPIGKQAIS